MFYFTVAVAACVFLFAWFKALQAEFPPVGESWPIHVAKWYAVPVLAFSLVIVALAGCALTL